MLQVEGDRGLRLRIQCSVESESRRVNALGDGEQAAGDGLLGQFATAVPERRQPRRSGIDRLRLAT